MSEEVYKDKITFDEKFQEEFTEWWVQATEALKRLGQKEGKS